MVEDYPRMLQDFEERFSSEEACSQYLSALRWPKGFECPGCGSRVAWAMNRGLWLCAQCRRQTSVIAGTVLQDTKLPLTVWFRAMWHATSQKNGISALGLQRALGLGSYRTAWALLHKLRRAMVRPGRQRLEGVVEVDDTSWGAHEAGMIGRKTEKKTWIVVAAEEDGRRIGRIRMRHVPDLTRKTVRTFIRQSIEPGSTLRTDGLSCYVGLEGYVHDRHVQRNEPKGEYLLPKVHRVVSLLKRWLIGTHQGAVRHGYLDDYLQEFTFRFNRRTSRSRGKLFYRLAQQAVQADPAPYEALTRHNM